MAESADGDRRAVFKEIDVERINIREKDGTLRMALFNNEQCPGWEMDGLTYERPKAAGIMFYDDRGVECGGLVFTRKGSADGYAANASLTFDRFDGDQVIGLQYSEEKGKPFYGITIWDRPVGFEAARKWLKANSMAEGPEKEAALREVQEDGKRGAFGRTRMFMGRSTNGDLKVTMADTQGRDRIRMVVDANDVPRIEFLNEKGDVIYHLPPELPVP